ncbi:MAG: hypothetical protein QME57_04915 [Patescibacteria group bacterium]|nr:hypothetical protein [Patescibacteria group bacterium]
MIGDKVKKFRKKKGLIQDVLARNDDIPYTTLTKLESNVFKGENLHLDPALWVFLNQKADREVPNQSQITEASSD